jgi:uncharacterized protein
MKSATTRLSRLYVMWVLKHRRFVCGVTTLVTVLAIGVCSQAVLSTSILELFFGQSPALQSYESRIATFGDSERCFLAVEMQDLIQPESWTRIDKITNELKALDEVESVESLTTAEAIWSEGGKLHLESYGPLWKGETVGPFKSKQQALNDPLIKGILVSDKGPTVLFLVEFGPDELATTEAMPAVFNKLIAVFKSAGIEPANVHAAGLLPESIESNRQTERALVVLLPLTMVLLLGAVFILFGQFWPVIITGGVSILSVVWTFAFALLLDPSVNIIMSMVPAITMVVAFSDVIHLCSAYTVDRQRGNSRTDAIVNSCGDVGEACFYTSITTLLGFAALTFIPTPALQQLGIVLGVGVAMALLIAVTLTPLALERLPEPKTLRSSSDLGTRLIARTTRTCRHLAKHHSGAIIIGTLVLCGLSMSAIPGTRVEASLSQRLATDNPVRQSHTFINEHFGGTYFLDYYIEAPKGESVLTPEGYQALVNLKRTIEAHPNIHKTLSIVDVINPLHKASNPKGAGPPKDSKSLSKYLHSFNAAGGEGIEKLIDKDHRTARILAQAKHEGFVAASETGNTLRREGQALLPVGSTLEVTGFVYLLGDWIRDVFHGCVDGLLFAFLTTLFMLVFGMRLKLAGLAAMIPNAVPIVFMIGALCWMYDHFDPESMFVGMIAIGIAVDDTIHFLTRLRQSLEEGDTLDEAVKDAFQYAGSAIIKTTLILCVGFLPFAFSDYLTTQFLGTLLPITLLSALFADLLLLPALVYAGILRIPTALVQKSIE